MRFVRFLFVCFFVFCLSFVVSAELHPSESVLQDCFLYDREEVFDYFQLVGYVSSHGHYVEELSVFVDYTYGLFCSDFLVVNRSDSAPSFYFSDPGEVVVVGGESVRGSGHVSFFNEEVDFSGEAFHGFTEGKCEVRIGGCEDSEVCVLMISDPEQGHVASCTQDGVPFENDFEYSICCQPVEYCRDGVDNTGDGLVDCASPDCHASIFNDFTPMRCDPGGYVPGNEQSTLECVLGGEPGSPVFSFHCLGPTPDDPWGHFFPEENMTYFCNYGEEDDPEVKGRGHCCPEGQYYDPEEGECTPYTQCGIEEPDFCHFDFNKDFNEWLDKVYDGTPLEFAKWCHSQLPIFTSFSGDKNRSDACCPIIHQGTFDYFIVDRNVKIYGYE